MEGYQIALTILGVIVGIYIILVLLDLIFILSFRTILNKHSRALAVFLQTKYDNIHRLIDILNKYGKTLDFKYIKMLTDINPKIFLTLDAPECKVARDNLCFIRDELVYIVGQDELLSKHNEVKNGLNSITEMDANYHILVASYNADVIGYNYWVHFLPTRYIYKLLKTKNKQLIA